MIGRGVAYRKTGLHGYCSSPPSTPSTGCCSSTVDLLEPPPATVHPRAPVHPASTARSSTGYCSTSPPRGPVQSAPPRGPVQPALHVWGPSTDYYSSTPHASSIEVMFIHCLLPRSSLHGLLFLHRRLPPASTSYCTSMEYCSSSLHQQLFNQPSTGSCSSTPTGNCSSSCQDPDSMPHRSSM